MSNVNHNMVILARESRSLTQSELALRMDVSQGWISKIEQGLLEIPDDILQRLSEILYYPVEFFRQSGVIYPSWSFQYRKRAAMSQKDNHKIQANINIRRLQIQRLLGAVDIDTSKLLHLSVEEYPSPSSIAQAIRSAWMLPRGPIVNLVKTVEDAGILVLFCDFQNHYFDGVTLITPELIPMIFVNSDIPGDRLRFTIAHELGHIIMHRFPSETMEDEANQFAAEFLLPQADILPDLQNLTLQKLADLKRHWKVSMAAILKRAKDLEAITDRSYRTLQMNMSAKGMRTQEPIPIPKENPTLLKEILQLYYTELGYSESDLSKSLLLNFNEFQEYYVTGNGVLRLVTR